MPSSEQRRREELVQTGRKMYERGWMAANDGNITIRLDEKRILATPTGVCKGQMHPDQLLICDNDGNKISGKRDRTTEMAMHIAIYRVRPDIHAVVHAHPPSPRDSRWPDAPELGLMPELIVSMGSVPLAEYGCRDARAGRRHVALPEI
jgi:L-fuculose-phosphate aldolase